MSAQPEDSHKPLEERSIEVESGAEIPAPLPEDRPMGAVEPLPEELVVEQPVGVELIPKDPTSTFEQGTLTALFVTPERIQSLHERGSAALDRIKQEVNKISLAAELFDRIEQSRQLLFEHLDRYDEAERGIVEVEHRLEFIQRVKVASRTVGTRLFAYELIVFIILSTLFVYTNLEPQSSAIKNASPLASVDLVQFINTLMWGGFGGVVGALYALWKHIASEQDFDPQYYLWYLTNPLLGIALGAFVFLVFQAGFFSLTAGVEETVTIRSALVIYVFAWVSGFKQNVVYEIVRRILDVFRVELGGKNAEKAASGQPKDVKTNGNGR
ncbi:MAG: hypothetical protein ROW48_15355 [Bellilinea sp.]|jgi:hypothetical protein